MTLAMAFWLVFLLALVFRAPQVRSKLPVWSGDLVFWLLIGILGWAQFGQPVHG